MAIVSCTGALDRDDARDAAQALWSTGAWSGRCALWDFRGARFDVSPDDVRGIAMFILRHQPDPPPAKMAFVVDRDVDYGMARIFEVFREDPRTEFRVFMDFEEAIAWAHSLDPGDA